MSKVACFLINNCSYWSLNDNVRDASMKHYVPISGSSNLNASSLGMSSLGASSSLGGSTLGGSSLGGSSLGGSTFGGSSISSSGSSSIVGSSIGGSSSISSNFTALPQRNNMSGPQFRGNNVTPTSMNPNLPFNLQQPQQQPSPNR